jgi:hypothetical protein
VPVAVSRWDDAVLQRRLWTPSLLRGTASLKSWYDAANLGSISAASGAATAVRDSSGFGLDLSVIGTVSPANLGLAVASAGTNSLGASGQPTAYDMFIVGTPLGSGGYRTFAWAATDMHPLLIDTANTNIGVYDGALKQAGSLTWAGFGLCRVRLVSGTNISMSRDGGALSAISSPNLTTTAPSQLMNAPAPGGQGFGTLNELIITSPALPEYQKVEGYLAWKWEYLGTGDFVKNLPASHRFKNRPPLIGD